MTNVCIADTYVSWERMKLVGYALHKHIYKLAHTQTAGLPLHPRHPLTLGYGYLAIYRHSHLSGVVWEPATSAMHTYHTRNHTPNKDITAPIDMDSRHWC